jgi:CRISPR/Cas system CMR subunit Cmr6 (Cas7 group RAMP superfamily)
MNDKTYLSTLKSQFSLIQVGITKQKSKNVLLSNSDELLSLDEASIDKKNEELFSKVIEFPIISTNSNEKKLGNWAKLSSKSYSFYLPSSSVLFALENGNFVCKSEENICKEVE